MQHRSSSLYDNPSKKEDLGQLSAVWSKNMLDKHSVAKSSRIVTMAQVELRNIGKVKGDLKAMLPSLTPAEVRRFYVAHHEAVILELEELGYEFAADYLKSLLEFDEQARTQAGPATVIWNKPRLRNQDDFIDRLRDGLIAAEEAKMAGQTITQTIDLLNTAIFFQTKTWEWWWIAEHLYQSSLIVAESIINDDQTLTLARYLYGRFLFHEMQDPCNAVLQLNLVREASEGKPWNASKILSEKQETIFRECNILLYKSLLILAKEISQKEPELAIKTCEESLSRATDCMHSFDEKFTTVIYHEQTAEVDANTYFYMFAYFEPIQRYLKRRNEYITEALYELGRSHLRAGDVKSALQHFAKLLAMAKRLPDPEGMCNAHMELAFAYKELDDNDSTEKHLRLFRETASEFGLSYKLAQAYYYTGEHFLGRAMPELSTFHLQKSFHLYSEEGANDEASRARCIAGVSKGQETMKQYIKLLLQCGDGNKNAILNICQWKNRRDISWVEEPSKADTSDEKIDNSEAVYYENSPVTPPSQIPSTDTN